MLLCGLITRHVLCVCEGAVCASELLIPRIPSTDVPEWTELLCSELDKGTQDQGISTLTCRLQPKAKAMVARVELQDEKREAAGMSNCLFQSNFSLLCSILLRPSRMCFCWSLEYVVSVQGKYIIPLQSMQNKPLSPDVVHGCYNKQRQVLFCEKLPNFTKIAQVFLPPFLEHTSKMSQIKAPLKHPSTGPNNCFLSLRLQERPVRLLPDEKKVAWPTCLQKWTPVPRQRCR